MSWTFLVDFLHSTRYPFLIIIAIDKRPGGGDKIFAYSMSLRTMGFVRLNYLYPLSSSAKGNDSGFPDRARGHMCCRYSEFRYERLCNLFV